MENHLMKNKIIIIPILIFIFIIFLIWMISYLFSFQWNEFQKKSFINYQTISMFIAGFGSLFAVLVALFKE
jgi:ABC-type sulfate transport system permease component